MRRIQPKVFLFGETTVHFAGVYDYLDHIGVKREDFHPLNRAIEYGLSDGETLVELMGRLCYRSWSPFVEGAAATAVNANVTKVREDSREYIGNIIKSRHGAVLEHSTATFVFADVSRVFTHELVRHRVGIAYSQESLRYVRLTDLGLWLPAEVQEKYPDLVRTFEEYFESAEKMQHHLAGALGLDDENFNAKKRLTSLMRRLAPIGLATTIGVTANHRTWRHLLELRTTPHAEVEIREVFFDLGHKLRQRWPHLYNDFVLTAEGWRTPYSKV